MKQTIIYLIRHGQTEWNLEERMQGHKDSPLTKVGIIQAKKLHESLINKKIHSIYSSESKRAYDTAKIIQGNRNIPFHVCKELKEINMGKWEGMKQADIITQYPNAWNYFWNNPEKYTAIGEGESYEKFKNRVIPTLNNIISSNQGKNIMIVTHRITIKIIMSYFKNQDIHEITNNPDINPASLSIISVCNGISKILSYGDTSHYGQ